MKAIKHVWKYDAVRMFCIHNNLYTRGCNDHYARMLSWCTPNHVVYYNDVLKIACDIESHSDTDLTVNDILLALYNECTTFIEI